MTTLRSAIADDLDKRAQEFMARHDEVSYIQALRAVLPEENHMSKYTTATAGVEVDARAKRYVAEHQGSSFQEAISVVLKADRQLSEAYAAPSPRRARMAAPVDKRSQPAIPIAPADEREVQNWVLRALEDNMEGLLPGSLGALAIEAARFKKEGMTAEEAVGRAMGLFPDLVTGAMMLIKDLRRNENAPVAEAAQSSPSYIVHSRAEALMQKHSELDYRSAVGAVLSEDPELKTAYART